MMYLSNTANHILDSLARQLDEQEMGYRFQSLVVEALRLHPDYADLYDNKGAGQPDCYSNRARAGFEIKCRRDSTRITLDENSWKALPTYEFPKLVAIHTSKAPFPIWAAELKGQAPAPISLSSTTRVDAQLEEHLRVHLSALIEAVGYARLACSKRSDAIEMVEVCSRSLTRSA